MKDREAIAGERLPHGSPVTIDADDRAFLALDLPRMDGVTRRDCGFTDAIEEGQPVRVMTDGGLVAAIAGDTRWVNLVGGRIVEKPR